MNQVVTPAERYLARWRDSGRPASDGEATRAWRAAAAEAFGASGFPTARREDWKYARLKTIEDGDFALAGESAVSADALSGVILPEAAHRIVLVDGRWSPELSKLGALPKGARIEPLAVRFESGKLEGLGDLADSAMHPFCALNGAFARDGVWIALGRGVRVEGVVQLIHWSTRGAAMSHPRCRYELDAGSELVVLESYAGGAADATFTNAVSEARLADGARFTHVRLQREPERAQHVGGLYASVGKGATLASRVLSVGGAYARCELRVSLDGEGANADLDGLYVGVRKQYLDHQVHVHHRAAHGTTRKRYKGILDDMARGVFGGKIVVHPEGVKTSAHQSTRSLLLSAQAEADSRPQLEIHTDDVQASHGATVGQLDPLELYYLRSRGLDGEAARNLLVVAFAREILDGLAPDAVRRYALAAVRDRLPGGDALEDME